MPSELFHPLGQVVAGGGISYAPGRVVSPSLPTPNYGSPSRSPSLPSLPTGGGGVAYSDGRMYVSPSIPPPPVSIPSPQPPTVIARPGGQTIIGGGSLPIRTAPGVTPLLPPTTTIRQPEPPPGMYRDNRTGQVLSRDQVLAKEGISLTVTSPGQARIMEEKLRNLPNLYTFNPSTPTPPATPTPPGGSPSGGIPSRTPTLPGGVRPPDYGVVAPRPPTPPPPATPPLVSTPIVAPPATSDRIVCVPRTACDAVAQKDSDDLVTLLNQREANARYDYVAGALQQYLEGVSQATMIWNWVSDLKKNEKDMMGKVGQIMGSQPSTSIRVPEPPKETTMVFDIVSYGTTVPEVEVAGRVQNYLNQKTFNSLRFFSANRATVPVNRTKDVFDAVEQLNKDGKLPGLTGEIMVGVQVEPAPFTSVPPPAVPIIPGPGAFSPPCERTGPITPPPNRIIPCPMDMRRCPDGSYVSRTGPMCDFAPCPPSPAPPLPRPVPACPTTATLDQLRELGNQRGTPLRAVPGVGGATLNLNRPGAFSVGVFSLESNPTFADVSVGECFYQEMFTSTPPVSSGSFRIAPSPTPPPEVVRPPTGGGAGGAPGGGGTGGAPGGGTPSPCGGGARIASDVLSAISELRQHTVPGAWMTDPATGGRVGSQGQSWNAYDATTSFPGNEDVDPAIRQIENLASRLSQPGNSPAMNESLVNQIRDAIDTAHQTLFNSGQSFLVSGGAFQSERDAQAFSGMRWLGDKLRQLRSQVDACTGAGAGTPPPATPPPPTAIPPPGFFLPGYSGGSPTGCETVVVNGQAVTRCY